MEIFKFTDYKKYVLERIANMPKKGRGHLREISLHLEVNSTVVSQIFKGSRDLTLDQALKFTKFWGMSDLESKYFITLVSKERAAGHELKSYYNNELTKLSEQYNQVMQRLSKDGRVINDQEKAIYYSDWAYVGVMALSSIPGYDNLDTIAEYFDLPKTKVNKIIEFLLETGICKKDNDKLGVGSSKIYLGKDSPYINLHRRNWRLKAMEHMDQGRDGLHFSNVVSLSKDDKKWIHEKLLDSISQISKRIGPSPEEELACLNIDWFSI